MFLNLFWSGGQEGHPWSTCCCRGDIFHRAIFSFLLVILGFTLVSGLVRLRLGILLPSSQRPGYPSEWDKSAESALPQLAASPDSPSTQPNYSTSPTSRQSSSWKFKRYPASNWSGSCHIRIKLKHGLQCYSYLVLGPASLYQPTQILTSPPKSKHRGGLLPDFFINTSTLVNLRLIPPPFTSPFLTFNQSLNS